jgi:hypothetical protein
VKAPSPSTADSLRHHIKAPSPSTAHSLCRHVKAPSPSTACSLAVSSCEDSPADILPVDFITIHWSLAVSLYYRTVSRRLRRAELRGYIDSCLVQRWSYVPLWLYSNIRSIAVTRNWYIRMFYTFLLPERTIRFLWSVGWL